MIESDQPGVTFKGPQLQRMRQLHRWHYMSPVLFFIIFGRRLICQLLQCLLNMRARWCSSYWSCPLSYFCKFRCGDQGCFWSAIACLLSTIWLQRFRFSFYFSLWAGCGAQYVKGEKFFRRAARTSTPALRMRSSFSSTMLCS